jgi:hypothetical protein
MSVREKFATQVDPVVLEQVRRLAREEGRQLQALIDEALRDLVDKRLKSRPRAHVMQAYLSTMPEYDSLYERLAK